MKDKPKELTGAAKPFIVWLHSILKSPIEDFRSFLCLLHSIIHFYQQPFTPDMIEYFVNCEYDYFNGRDYFTTKSEKLESITLQFSGDEDDNQLFDLNPIPKTLNDFITACNNSGIKLMYKDE